MKYARSIESDPDTDNGTLLAGAYWILSVLGIETSVLSGERQRGLVAELLLLRRLLQLGRDHSIGSQVILDRWWGPVGGKRDFAAVGIFSRGQVHSTEYAHTPYRFN